MTHTDPGDQNIHRPESPPVADSTDPRQAGLFDGAYARSSDPQTSKDAARRVDVTKMEGRVLVGLGLLEGSGTTAQIAKVMNTDKWSISPRMKPLEKKGEIRRTDMRWKGQIIWKLL